jgi:hypothetical protein
MNFRYGLLAIALVLASGCTHTYNIKGFDADRAQLQNAKDKKVAVVFAPDQFKKNITINADGHTFIFQNNDEFYRQAYGSALNGVVAKADFHATNPGPGYDVYLYPGLSLEITRDFTTKTCVANYSLAAKDAAGAELARQTKTGNREFVVIANAENACKIAMLEVFDAVTYPVLRAIDK